MAPVLSAGVGGWISDLVGHRRGLTGRSVFAAPLSLLGISLMRALRIVLLLTGIALLCHFPVSAQSADLERSGIVYVIGTVIHMTPGGAVIDLGEAHTLRDQDSLAVFRPANNYFEAKGLAAVTRAGVTFSLCDSQVVLEENDVVMTVRELSQISPGRKHRTQVLTRQVIRTAGEENHTTVRNVRIAQALLDYELQYPGWERSQSEVVGTLLSGSLRSDRSDRRDHLLSQIDLMRELYQQGTEMIPAAGKAWEQVIDLLAGPTARAEHDSLPESEAAEDADVAVTAGSIRVRVLEQVFDLRPEQQNTIAMLVAALATGESTNRQNMLTTLLRRSQFPELADDEQLLEDMRSIVRALGDLWQSAK